MVLQGHGVNWQGRLRYYVLDNLGYKERRRRISLHCWTSSLPNAAPRRSLARLLPGLNGKKNCEECHGCEQLLGLAGSWGRREILSVRILLWLKISNQFFAMSKCYVRLKHNSVNDIGLQNHNPRPTADRVRCICHHSNSCCNYGCNSNRNNHDDGTGGNKSGVHTPLQLVFDKNEGAIATTRSTMRVV